MIDFTKSIEARKRPDSVLVGGKEYPIRTEFFQWVLFGRKIIKKCTYGELDYLYVCEIPEDREAGFNELLKFYKNEQPLPHPSDEKSDVIGVEWKIDSEYIRAAFLEKYRIDLLTTDIHFHDFLALFNALTGTKINDIMSARYYKKPDKKKSDPMIKVRDMWAIKR